jgi:hypothetical protein
MKKILWLATALQVGRRSKPVKSTAENLSKVFEGSYEIVAPAFSKIIRIPSRTELFFYDQFTIDVFRQHIRQVGSKAMANVFFQSEIGESVIV